MSFDREFSRYILGKSPQDSAHFGKICSQIDTTTVKESFVNSSPKRKRARRFFSTNELIVLEKEFERTNYVPKKRKIEISRNLNLPEKTVKLWFQNRRNKKKRNIKNELSNFLDFGPYSKSGPGRGDSSSVFSKCENLASPDIKKEPAENYKSHEEMIHYDSHQLFQDPPEWNLSTNQLLPGVHVQHQHQPPPQPYPTHTNYQFPSVNDINCDDFYIPTAMFHNQNQFHPSNYFEPQDLFYSESGSGRGDSSSVSLKCENLASYDIKKEPAENYESHEDMILEYNRECKLSTNFDPYSESGSGRGDSSSVSLKCENLASYDIKKEPAENYESHEEMIPYDPHPLLQDPPEWNLSTNQLLTEVQHQHQPPPQPYPTQTNYQFPAVNDINCDDFYIPAAMFHNQNQFHPSNNFEQQDFCTSFASSDMPNYGFDQYVPNSMEFVAGSDVQFVPEEDYNVIDL